MRESTHTYPQSNRAVTIVSQYLYDRRALDCNSPIALLNSLTNLTYLTSTSPRIREVLTYDGGLERLLDILREASVSKIITPAPDLWGLNGPSTARVINLDRQISLRHSLAFQCIVNIGVRGSEMVRTRVVQSGSLDLVAQILEEWLLAHDIVIEPSTLGSRDAVEALARGRPYGMEQRRRQRAGSRHTHTREIDGEAQPPLPHGSPVARRSHTATDHSTIDRPLANTHITPPTERPVPQQVDTDVDMADNEHDGMSEAASAAGDNGMDVDGSHTSPEQLSAAAAAATPRASSSGLPNHPALPAAVNIPARRPSREDLSGASSGANSFSGGDESRAISDHDVSDTARPPHRPPPLNLTVARIPGLAQGGLSNQSSPMGTPTRMEPNETLRAVGRRGTIIGRPLTLAPQANRAAGEGQNAIESGASDVGEEVDLNAAAINAGIQAAIREGDNAMGTAEPAFPPNVEIVETQQGPAQEEPDAEALAAEQARLDLEAGAPPGQPGAVNTPPAPVTGAEGQPATATGEQATAAAPAGAPTEAAAGAAVIIANGAPRGFHDLGSYVGISSLLNPDGDRFSDDCVLLCLQLLAYLSKYPNVRTAFHHPRRPMHPTFDLGLDDIADPLPPKPALSATDNVFSLVERYTFRSSAADPSMFKIPSEIQYWAGVIMRNACRKDEQQGGIRQCAHMSCGKWEKFAREFAKCRRCRKAKYCSKDCQSKAWAEGHRFWCNARSDDQQLEGGQAGDDALRAALESSLEQTNDVMEHMPPNNGLPRDILQRAVQVARALGNLTTAQLATGTRNALADTDTTEIDPRTIAQWVWTVLNTGLHGRSEEDRAHFYRIVRSQPDALRTLFVQSMTHPRALQEGIEPFLRRRPQPQPQPQPQPHPRALQQVAAAAAAAAAAPTRTGRQEAPRTGNPAPVDAAPQRAPHVPVGRPGQTPHPAAPRNPNTGFNTPIPHVPNPRVLQPRAAQPEPENPQRARPVTNHEQPPARPGHTTFAQEWNRYLTGQTGAPPPHPGTAAAGATGTTTRPQGTVSDPNVPTQGNAAQGTAANRFGGRTMLSGLFGRMGNTRPNGQTEE